jgi:tRNA G37 N-methylase Trm5|tara:strand:+ start:230 stop:517 length:288 start_codon:yes stop_codon:yes gene_type:complete
MKVKEIKSKLKELGLSVKGKKADLEARLAEATMVEEEEAIEDEVVEEVAQEELEEEAEEVVEEKESEDIVEIDGVMKKKLYDEDGNFIKYTKKLD